MTTNGNGKQSKFEMSIDTRVLYDLLSKAEIGETVTFGTMSDTLGRTCEGNMPQLQSALRHLLNQDAKAFVNVRKVGYKRMTDSEIVASGSVELHSIRRRATKAGKRITCVQDFGKLSKDEQVRHNAFLSVFAAMRAMSATSAVKKIEGEVAKLGQSLPLAKTLEAFK